MDYNRLCLGCFKEKKSGTVVCPYCGFEEKVYNETAVKKMYLPAGTILQGRYLIGKVLGAGGFGITYLAFQMNLNRVVAIKEFFPSNIVMRSGQTASTAQDLNLKVIGEDSVELFDKTLSSFETEGQNLASINLPGVVGIYDCFRENSTAYLVMEYISGLNLKEYQKSKGGRLEEKELLILLEPVIRSMVKIHERGIIHRDISPDNLILNTEGKLVLVDFGAARSMTGLRDNKGKSITVVLKQGYAPLEQYNSRGNQGPWTDVYALCATIYRLLTGKTPEEVSIRILNSNIDEDTRKSLLEGGITRKTADAVTAGMRILYPDRIQDMPELWEALYRENDGAGSEMAGDSRPNTAEPAAVLDTQKDNIKKRSIEKEFGVQREEADKRTSVSQAGTQIRKPANEKTNPFLLILLAGIIGVVSFFVFRNVELKKAAEKQEIEWIALEKAESEKAESERIAREKAESEAESEKAAKMQAESERIAREKAESEVESEKAARAQAESERIAKEKAESEVESEKKAWEKAESEAESEKVAKAQAESERIAKDKEESEFESEKKAKEQAESERKIKETTESEAESKKGDRGKALAEEQKIEIIVEQAEKLYYDGDFEKAFKLYQKAAEAGNAVAMYMLSQMYSFGNGVDENDAIATEWFEKAFQIFENEAENGDTTAMNYLAYMYERGEGVKQDYKKAVELYEKSAEAGNAVALGNLAYMYERGEGVEQDYEKAVELYEKSAEAGSANALQNLANMYRSGEGVKQDYEKAVELYEKSAEAGNAYAFSSLAYMYERGEGVKQDYGKVMEYYEKAAEAGDTNAMNSLVYVYERGLRWFIESLEAGNSQLDETSGNKAVQGVLNSLGYDCGIPDGSIGEKTRNAVRTFRRDNGMEDSDLIDLELMKKILEVMDYFEAESEPDLDLKEWYTSERIAREKDGSESESEKVARTQAESERIAKEKAESEAMGIPVSEQTEAEGYDIEKLVEEANEDYARHFYNGALREYQIAAEAGNSIGMYMLGIMYEHGEGVKQDYEKAVEWYRKAVDSGYKRAMVDLGYMYLNGYGVKKDYATALEWYEKGAEAGFNSAMYSLGCMYFAGHGVEQDYNKAAEWYLKAADAGNADAMYQLGNMYQLGHGVEEDYEKAVGWYQGAAEAGDAEAMQQLGNMFHLGCGVEQDNEQAEKWYQNYQEIMEMEPESGTGIEDFIRKNELERKKTESRLYESANELNNHSSSPYFEEAFKLYLRAALAGEYLGLLQIGNMYRWGLGGVEKDCAEALKWYRIAAETDDGLRLGRGSAMREIAYVYDYEYKDYEKAFEWYQKAAEAGEINGMSHVAFMYTDGGIVEINYKEALRWWTRYRQEVGYAFYNDDDHDGISAIKAIQGMLNALGYECGTVDGTIGEKTKNAIRSFRRDYGMKDSDRIDLVFMEKLLEVAENS